MGLYAPDGSYNVTSKSVADGDTDSVKVTDPDDTDGDVTVIGLLRGILEQLIAINANTAA